MNTTKKEAVHDLTQYELSTQIITKLNTFKLTPTAKLVLLYLTTCYNPKHKEVFPKQKTIAEKLGVSEISVTRAISELHKEGLVISERKYTNRYKFTSRIVSECGINLIDDKIQIDREESIKLIDHEHEQKNETKKEQTNEDSSAIDSNSIEIEGFKILKDYAIKHRAKNVNAYINVLRKNGSAEKIICEYKKRKRVTQIALCSYKETQELLRRFEEYKKDTAAPTECEAWQKVGKKIGIKKKPFFM